MKIISLEKKIRSLGLKSEARLLRKLSQEWTDDPLGKEMDIIGREVSRGNTDWSKLNRLQQAEKNESGVWDSTHYAQSNISNTNKWMSHVAKEIADILHLSAPAFIGASSRNNFAAGAYAWSVSLPNGESAVLKICRKEELRPYKKLVNSNKNISLLPRVYLAKTFEEFDKIIPGGYKPPVFSNEYAVVLMEELVPAPKEILNLISDNPIEINSIRIFASDRENIIRLADIFLKEEIKHFFDYNFYPFDYSFTPKELENKENIELIRENYKNIMDELSLNIKEFYYFMIKKVLELIVKESENIDTTYQLHPGKLNTILKNVYESNFDKLKNIMTKLFLFTKEVYKSKSDLDSMVKLFINKSTESFKLLLYGDFFHKASEGSKLVLSLIHI